MYAWLLSNSNVIHDYFHTNTGYLSWDSITLKLIATLHLVTLMCLYLEFYPYSGLLHQTHCFDDLTSTFNFKLRRRKSPYTSCFLDFMHQSAQCSLSAGAYIRNGHTNLHVTFYQAWTGSRCLRHGVRLRLTIVQSSKMCEQQKHG